MQRREGDGDVDEQPDRFRALADHAADLVAEFDSDGRFLYASPSYRTLLGYEPAELVGQVPHDLIHPDDREGSRTTFDQAVDAEAESFSVHRLRHQDGSWRWFDNTGRAFRTRAGELRFVSVGRDITERKRTEDMLARKLRSEQRLLDLSRHFLAVGADQLRGALERALAEASRVAGADRAHLVAVRRGGFDVISHDPSGAGPPSLESFPWFLQRIRQGDLLKVVHLRDLPDAAEADRKELIRRDTASLLVVPVRVEGVQIGALNFESSVEREWSGDEITLLHLTADLFAGTLRRMRAEKALEESRSQLAHVQKMEAVGRLAGGIAHDFNNLLMVIAGFSASLAEDLPVEHPSREDASEIERAVERASRLTQQLLTLSRRQIVRRERVDLNRAVSGLESLLRGLLGENHDLEIDLDRSLPPVLGDAGQLEQVLVNLAMNARQAMGTGGTLRVATRRQALTEADAQRLGLAGPGSHAVLSVRDTGHGIRPELRERVFEPFFTTRSRSEGTGLGLSIVYGIVRQWGGAIELHSQPGQGTTLEIVLPGLELEPDPVAPADPRVTRGGSETVLLAEDEAPLRRLMRKVLERAGYTVLEAANGEDALAVVRQHGPALDLLVTDVVMPRMGGVALAARLREEWPGLRVLFVSGYPQDAAAADAGELTAEGAFLQKPCSPRELLDTVRDTLDAD